MARSITARPVRRAPIPVSQIRTVLRALIPAHGALSDQQIEVQALLTVLPADLDALVLEPASLAAALHQAKINCGRTHLQGLGAPSDHAQDAAAILRAALRPAVTEGGGA